MKKPDLNEETRLFLKELKQNAELGLTGQALNETRAALKQFQCEVSLPDSLRAQIPTSVEQRDIAGPYGSIPIRIYTPGQLLDDFPRTLVVFYHGGGWVLGDLDSYEETIKYLCHKSGATFVSVAYRLAPEFRFPVAVEECYLTLCWVEEMVVSLGCDPNRICVAGDSAGGNLAAAVCHISKSRAGPKIARQILFYPVLEAPGTSNGSRELFGDGEYVLSNEELSTFVSLYANRSEDLQDFRLLPSLAEDFSGLPDLLMIAAQCDLLCEEGKAYAERLKAAGVSVDYKMYTGTIHGFITFAGAISLGIEAMDEAARYISLLRR